MEQMSDEEKLKNIYLTRNLLDLVLKEYEPLRALLADDERFACDLEYCDAVMKEETPLSTLCVFRSILLRKIEDNSNAEALKLLNRAVFNILDSLDPSSPNYLVVISDEGINL